LIGAKSFGTIDRTGRIFFELARGKGEAVRINFAAAMARYSVMIGEMQRKAG
jgi:hypothetical protein